ncbi:SGNH/GDSL hydrolase family protein [Gordonia alkaliphila]|uniref:SGNH/GDSL hydrolase family protein n=1 Tax=Gordonia alkaliphila TaxID=1053547 RepID=UPI001FF36C56|nr:SGNH/GDSL hydrolase family protein [Gordonia alkaliphila]MCK0438581.1 SGNH/GDSL hydrolase family protein [Gordonia alkaliphila]
MTRAVTALVATLLAATLLVLFAGCATPADETPVKQAHLGDSFAAGTGVRPLVADSSFLCQRAEGNFGRLVAADRGTDLTDVSCAGATTADLTAAQYEGVGPQLDALDADTDLVTLALGGNDADVFATAVSECARLGRADPEGAPCRAALGNRLFAALDTVTRPALTAGLRAIAERAPHARVMIVGYPWLLPPTDGCFAQVPIAAGDVVYLHRLQQRLNQVVADAAAAAGAVYVDMAQASVGHSACADPQQRWIAPLGGVGSLHPTELGQRAMAESVLARL